MNPSPNNDSNTLPIEELPPNLLNTYNKMQEALKNKEALTARDCMGDILEYYVAISMEIPDAIEFAYAHLLILENPPQNS